MQKLIGQLLDVDYMMVNNKPLLRIFCKQKDGKTICLLYNKYLPYFYLVSPEENYEDIKKNILKVYPNLKFEILEKFLPIGYNKKVKALKIIGNDPSKIPEIRGLAEKFGTCYEADILFKYRFMADMQLRGMEWIEADGKPAKTNTVNCDCFEINSIKKIDIQENAPLKYLSLDIECITDATD
ncbi:MAG: 3'-5' exonuclease, partial [Candidatus Pacearchaeota archaeon]